MATWQFDLHLIPQDSAILTDLKMPILFEEPQTQDLNWWADSSVAVSKIREEFSSLLPHAASWSDYIEKWGKDDSNRIDLIRSDVGVVGVFVRIDLRQLSMPFIKGLLNVCRSLGCMILIEQREVIAPEEFLLLRAISESAAAKFVDNPCKFLDNLQQD